MESPKPLFDTPDCAESDSIAHTNQPQPPATKTGTCTTARPKTRQDATAGRQDGRTASVSAGGSTKPPNARNAMIPVPPTRPHAHTCPLSRLCNWYSTHDRQYIAFDLVNEENPSCAVTCSERALLPLQCGDGVMQALCSRRDRRFWYSAYFHPESLATAR